MASNRPPAWAQALIADVRAIRTVLEQTRSVRDSADADALHMLAATIGPRPFSTREVFILAGVDKALRRALEGADLTSAVALGKLLARVAGQRIGTLFVARAGQTRDGQLWVCREGCDDHLRTLA